VHLPLWGQDGGAGERCADDELAPGVMGHDRPPINRLATEAYTVQQYAGCRYSVGATCTSERPRMS